MSAPEHTSDAEEHTSDAEEHTSDAEEHSSETSATEGDEARRRSRPWQSH